jgi:pimeloyl-ACP methyl ester carboxylesterase
MTAKPTFVLVHGAWQGAWAWDTIVPRLKAAGHDAIAVDLPGNGHDQTPPGDVNLDRYAQHVASIIDKIEGPIVLVGHSMGGTATAQACELRPERVALAIYLAALLLPDGLSVMQFYERYLEPWMRGATTRVTHSADGLLSSIDPAAAVEVFYHQADPALAKAAAARLTPQPEGGRRSQLHLTPERFGRVPRVYVEALQDRSVHLPLQRRMQALTPCLAVYSLDTDHAPQLSAPDALTGILLEATAAHASIGCNTG